MTSFQDHSRAQQQTMTLSDTSTQTYFFLLVVLQTLF